jgi:hypothetical protein
MRKALVTFAIGEKHKAAFNAYFRKSVETYAKKFNYDFICIESRLHPFTATTRANGILMQKLLITTQPWSKNYDYIVWIDSDIYITPHAEDIIPYCQNTTKVCATNQASHINRRQRLLNQLMRGYEQTSQQWYKDRGIDTQIDDVLQSGVMVFQPAIHAPVCQEIYDRIIKNPHYKRHGEDQPFISYELLKQDQVHFIPWEFNTIWTQHYNIYKQQPSDEEKTAIMGKLMFITNFIHYTSLEDVNIIEKAKVRYNDYVSKIK